MQKIPTVFVRDFDARPAYVTEQVNLDCQWVLDGEGSATRKFDGTCVQLDEDGQWWARREVKPGKTAPDNFVPVTTDEVTGKTMGWEPIGQSSFARWHTEALANHAGMNNGIYNPRPGTYELIGPKVNGNPEREQGHWLIEHATAEVSLDDRDHDLRSYEAIRELVLGLGEQNGWEGLVYHHPDGRMAKIKRRDYKRDVSDGGPDA